MQESRRPIRLAAVSMCVIASWWPSAVAAENCTPIKFKPGGNSTVVQGIAPRQHPCFTESQLEATVLCYEIATAKGQRASVRLLPGTGRNVVFGIDHVIDPGYQPAAGVRFKVLEPPARAWVLEAENCNRRQ